MRAAAAYQASSRKRLLLLSGFVILLLLCMLADLLSGPGDYSLSAVLSTLLDADAQEARLRIIIWDIRLPTVLIAVLVGAMLSAAGAGTQTILNNPLAEPFTLGISSAAGFGAALAIVFGAELVPAYGNLLITISSFACALLTSILLYFFTRIKGASSETMVLVGIALMFAFNALLSLLQYLATDVQLSQIVFWTFGSLGKADWANISICALVFVVVMPLFACRAWALTALRLGDEKAASMGVNVDRLRIEVLVAITLLAATAVSFVGTIAFVGLVGPHIARLLIGEDQRFFLPMSVLSGAVLMSLTSLLSKTLTPGVIYPVGIITSLIGIPFFISLVLTSRRKNWS